jgi:hypothetical protein
MIELKLTGMRDNYPQRTKQAREHDLTRVLGDRIIDPSAT